MAVNRTAPSASQIYVGIATAQEIQDSMSSSANEICWVYLFSGSNYSDYQQDRLHASTNSMNFSGISNLEEARCGSKHPWVILKTVELSNVFPTPYCIAVPPYSHTNWHEKYIPLSIDTIPSLFIWLWLYFNPKSLKAIYLPILFSGASLIAIVWLPKS